MNSFQNVGKATTAFVVLFLSVTTPATAANRQVTHKMDLAQEFYFNGNDKMAIREYQAALAIDPKALEARVALISLFTQDGASQQAIAECREYLKVQPTDQNVWLALGNLLGNSSDLNGAIDAFQKAIDNGADASSSHYTLGMILIQHNDFKGAVSSLEKATQEKPNFTEALLALGVAQFRSGDIEVAYKGIDSVIANNKKDSNAHIVKGDLLIADGKTDQALEQYKLAAQYTPSNLQAWTSMGDIYLQKSDLAAAQEAYAGALKVDLHCKNALYGLGIALEQDSLPQAILAIKRGLSVDTDPESSQAMRNHLELLTQHPTVVAQK